MKITQKLIETNCPECDNKMLVIHIDHIKKLKCHDCNQKEKNGISNT